jgi:glycosyltransferase involved in cell wall biosynthesis/GT2 family glycosyltransferase
VRIGIIEPHLRPSGGIRRMVELANRLVDGGHAVTFYLPEGERLRCGWLPCRARIARVAEGRGEELDVIVFNDEPQWHLLALFERARARVFYALAASSLYAKPGSWEAPRADVDLVLANSAFTAGLVERETGVRPEVLLGGINRAHFRPVDVPKRYPLLCVGDRRPWKGTHVVEEAARLLGMPLEKYGPKRLRQEELAAEYSRAEVFAVGSPFEGFGQPGLEALACGIPLVTTDNGGCREYALDGETALVVPPDDPRALADAVAHLRTDPELAARLRRNGLALVEERFDWDRSAGELEAHLERAVEQAPPARARQKLLRHECPAEPELTVVVPVWDGLTWTQAFVESVRRHTDVPYELVIVDNGSGWEAKGYAREAADVAILNGRNRGFAAAMNQGLRRARGRAVAFCNNDTVLPPGWSSRLVAHLDDPSAGIVVPAVTAARNPLTVRREPGEEVERVRPFAPPPPAVVYVLRTETARALGGFGEEFEPAGSEDVDLAFKVWVNGLDIVYDSRVLVRHASKATAAAKLGDWEAVWRRNRKVLLAKWQSADPGVPRLRGQRGRDYQYRLQVAASVASWMDSYFEVRERSLREIAAGRARRRLDTRLRSLGLRVWPRVTPYLSGDRRHAVVAAYRRLRGRDTSLPVYAWTPPAGNRAVNGLRPPLEDPVPQGPSLEELR